MGLSVGSISGTSSAAPIVRGGEYGGPGPELVSWPYSSANTGRFRPWASMPWMIISISVNVVVAHAGATLSVGTTPGAYDVCTVGLSSPGQQDVTLLTAFPEMAAAGYLYATPSTGLDEGDVIISYNAVQNNVLSSGLYLNTEGRARFLGARFVNNGVSDVVYIGNADMNGGPLWEMRACQLENYDPIAQKAISANAAAYNLPIFDCRLYTDGIWYIPLPETLNLVDAEMVAIYVNSAGTSFSSAGEKRVPFDTKQKDTHAAVTPGGDDWIFTAPVAGFYDFNLGIRFVDSTGQFNGTSELMLFNIYAGAFMSEAVVRKYNIVPGSGAKNAPAQISGCVWLALGDNFYVTLTQGSGASLSLEASALVNFIDIRRRR